MKLPRDINGETLVKLLGKKGYSISRQAGSHIRLTTEQLGTHHVTIPAHRPLKVGTLASILNDIATHFGTTKETLIRELFG